MSIKSRFEEFHAKNPEVYRALVKVACKLRSRGHRSFGIKMLFEVVRWQYAMGRTKKRVRINNDFTAHYARLIMRQELYLRDVFKTRRVG